MMYLFENCPNIQTTLKTTYFANKNLKLFYFQNFPNFFNG